MFDSMYLAAIGTCVQSTINPRIKGKVAGYGVIGNQVKYLVELNQGVHTEDRASFIGTMIMDPSSCKEIMG